MKFLIIIPAHNEENNLFFCLKSLENQSFQNYQVVVVNDGSTDKTKEIAEEIAFNNPKFKILNLEKSAHQPGAKVVRTFYKGIENENIDEFDVICKFDADIVFPEDYLEKINKIYEENPKSGIVSGLVFIRENQEELNEEKLLDFSTQQHWIFENLSSKNHVRGPIKSYRTQCFKGMNGLREVLGWDNIDVMLAQKYGWKVITIKDLWVKHLRPTAYKYKQQKAEKLGEYFYNIGLDFPLAAISSAKSSLKNKSVSEFFITMKSFFGQKQPRSLNSDEIKFIRRLRWKAMFKTLTK